MKKLLFVVVLVMALAMLAVNMVFAGGVVLVGVFSGAAEVPGPGDPDGAGFVSVAVNSSRSEVCFYYHVTNIDPGTASHIHIGHVGIAGGVVINLGAPDAGGNHSGCVTGVSNTVIRELRRNPSNYYVNVHNAAFPAGAVRAQLLYAP